MEHSLNPRGDGGSVGELRNDPRLHVLDEQCQSARVDKVIERLGDVESACVLHCKVSFRQVPVGWSTTADADGSLAASIENSGNGGGAPDSGPEIGAGRELPVSS